MVYSKSWRPLGKHRLALFNALVTSKISNQYQLWTRYFKLFLPRFFHPSVSGDVHSHLQTYYLEHHTTYQWKRFSSHTVEQSKTRNFHPTPLLASKVNDHNQNVRLQQMIEEYQHHSHVDLSKQELTDKDMGTIVNEVMVKKQCKQLLLESNKITSAGVSILAQAFHHNHSLNYLDLSSNQISDDGIDHLIRALSTNNSTLKKLGLAKTGMTDHGVKYLLPMIKTNKTLTQLDLCSNEISNEGIRILTNAMENYKSSIEMLWLVSNTLLTDASVDYIIPMVKHTRSLKRLWLFRCSLSPMGKEKLKKLEELKPNFKVYVNNWKN